MTVTHLSEKPKDEQLGIDALSVQDLNAGYGKKLILQEVNAHIAKGKITSLLGPNGSGKSTLLKACTKILNISSGQVLLQGQNIAKLSTREMALKLATLPQSAVAPANLSVRDLVEQGRYAQVGPFGMLRSQDHHAITQAIEQVGLSKLIDRDVDTLSGGERQRAWIALTLAQQTQLLALDEPTTYLDIGHQLEVLELIKALNQKRQLTVVMVLHDLNHAAQFSDHLIVLQQGKIVASGTPWDVLTPRLLRQVFGVEASIIEDPMSGSPFILAHRAAIRTPKIKAVSSS